MTVQQANPKDTLQNKRLITRAAFFGLFLLAPVLNIFRYDLTETRFVLLGFPLSFNLNLDWVVQSIAWMTHGRGQLVTFDTTRASACREVQKNNPEGSLLHWQPGEPSRQTVLIPVHQLTSSHQSDSKPARKRA